VSVRISGKLHGELLRSLGRTDPFKDGAELIVALAEMERKIEEKNKRIHAAEMQATGQRLARERRELEAAEEAGYDSDFHQRFGERSRLPAASATAEDAERRRIAEWLKVDPSQVI
jgi:hypothetical protein